MYAFEYLDDAAKKTLLSAGLFAMIAGIAAAAYALLIIKGAHDIVLRKHYRWYLLALPLVVGVFLIAKRTASLNMARIAEQFLTAQTLLLADRLRQAELMQIERLSSTDIYASLADARTLSRVAAKSVTVVWCATTILICWFSVFARGVAAGLLFLFGLLLMYLVGDVYKKLYAAASHEEQEQEAAMFHAIHHLLDGHKELAIHRSKNDDLFEHHLTPTVLQTEALSQRSAIYFAGLSSSGDVIYSIGLGVLVFVLSFWYPNHLTLALLTILLCVWPLIYLLLRDVLEIAEGTAAMERLAALTDLLKPSRSGAEAHAASVDARITDFHSLTLQELGFTYTAPDGAATFAIGPISLTINAGAGDILFLAGGNGGGKTTFLKVLTGLYPASSGQIAVNGAPVQRPQLRRLFAGVWQNFHLFDSLYGLESVDMPRLNALLLRMELTEKTRWKDGRFTSLRLSAGQQRRLALAAALMEDKPVYVFDEWAADQSPDFRRYFYEDLLPDLKQQGKTIIAVTHDEHYYHVADRVIRMDYGRIVREEAPS